MYLLFDPETSLPVFTEGDPRDDGFEGPIKPNVTLDRPQDDQPQLGHPAVADDQRCLGVSNQDESRYRVFDSLDECENADFRFVSAWQGHVYESWDDYSRAKLGL
ncbi:MAG: hypothetical protein WD278_05070 [Pirellulales bacterium]